MKQLFNITIENPVDTGQQHLTICIGDKYCSFAVTLKTGNKLSRIGHFTHDVVDAGFLEELFSIRTWPDSNFEKVNIHIDTPRNILIPLKYHSQENKELLLRVMNGTTGDEEIISDLIPQWQLYNVFSLRKEVSDYLKLRFPSAKFNHVYSSFIRAVKLNDPNGSFLLDFKDGEFSVIAFKENKILLAQSFNYYKPDDVIYHLLNICNHFSLSQKEIELQIAGLLEEQSSLYKELCQFFLRVTFRIAPDWGVISSGEIKYPAHYFASLNEHVRCAS